MLFDPLTPQEPLDAPSLRLKSSGIRQSKICKVSLPGVNGLKLCLESEVFNLHLLDCVLEIK